MGFSLENGYTPLTIETIMDSIMENVNTQFGTSYTTDTFVGTNFYKYFYAQAQRMQENEIKMSEIFLRMQEYFDVTNEEIQRPNTTNPGVVDYFSDRGYFVSAKPPADADAGKAFICIEVDDSDPTYDTVLKPLLCQYISECVPLGIISQGTESEAINLSNGQSFDFKYNLPAEIPVVLKLTTTLSDNNQFSVLSATEQKELLIANIAARYKLGQDFEPQRYFSVVDAPWAATVLLEWSSNGGGLWQSTVYDADYDDIFTFDIGDITLVES